MKTTKILSQAAVCALGVLVYTAIVSLVITRGEHFFDPTDYAFGPVIVLLLFVVSAAITGLLVFGRPAYLFLNGLKKEAVKLALYTVAALVIIIILVFIVFMVAA